MFLRATFRLLPACLPAPGMVAAADDLTQLERDDSQWAMPAKNRASAGGMFYVFTLPDARK
jgi:hypothetical protein